MNINALMQQAQKMQREMTKKQKELESKEFEFTSNGGAIKIKMLGSKQITSLEIDEDLIDPSEKEIKLVYQVTVIYYNLDGIFAKGTKLIESQVISSDYAANIELIYSKIVL